MASPRALLLNTLIVVCATVVAALALESAVRALNLAPVGAAAGGGLNAILEFDPQLESRYKPNSQTRIRSPYGEYDVQYLIDELGLRDANLKGDSGKEVRVLVAGNSFVEGWGVKDEAGFVHVAERKAIDALRGKTEKPAHFINAGIAAYGAAQINIQVRQLWPKLQPDIVVMVVVGTMVSGDHKFLKMARLNPQGIAQGLSADQVLSAGTSLKESKVSIPPLLEKLAKFSAIARFAAQRMTNRQLINQIKNGDPETDMLAAYRSGSQSLAQMYEPTLRHAGALADFVRQQDKTFILVHLPMPFQVDANAWSEGRRAYRLDNQIYGADENNIVRDFCETQKLACLFADDLIRSEAQKNPSRELYFKYDFHLTPEGNRIVGEWLGAQIAKLIESKKSLLERLGAGRSQSR